MRILVADDHPVVRRHVRNILQNEKDWVVCAEAATGREAVDMTAATRPDVVVLDLSMPELSGLEAARLIHAQFPETELLVLTAHEPFEIFGELRACGVRACVLKSDLRLLISTIHDIWERRPCLPAVGIFQI